ncbi:MAG: U32 family peptidase [Clostridia bacterium]|nr:U32 family peptidase [Clostridia bacterium]
MMKQNPPNLPELLAPAGSEESLAAALAAGADAVYFGGKAFSNRMRARNFTDDSLKSAIALIHDAGAKAYITVNTRVRDRETDEALALCETILGGTEPCDAVICADFGLAARIRSLYPHAVLHASTQTSCSSPSDCAELAKLGFSRLVIPRELSADEIRTLCRETDMEIEMFLHGAHCVSLSGQCLLSYFIGNRSGNRGECAQPCRLPWQTADGQTGYPLSLADMCLAGQMRDVIRSGVCSLKIEGRLKTPSYVYGVTKILRTLLDEDRNADEKEIRALAGFFTRGFTDGYFTHRYTSMTGTKASEKNTVVPTEIIRAALNDRVRLEKDKKKRAEEEAKRPLTGHFVLCADNPMTFTLSDGSVSVTAEGDVPSMAAGKPIDSASAAKNLTKFGATAFVLPASSLVCDIGDGLWVPVSSLNDLRRRALQLLETALAEKTADHAPPAGTDLPSVGNHLFAKRAPSPSPAQRTAEFLDLSALEAASEKERSAVFSAFARIYVPWTDAAALKAMMRQSSCEAAAVLPPLDPSSSRIGKILSRLKESGITRVLCHTPGQAADVIGKGMTADISFRANIVSEAAANYYDSLGCASVFASPELPAPAVCAMGLAACVYGKLPAMTLSRCVICQNAQGKAVCPKGNISGRTDVFSAKEHRCRRILTDRTGAQFAVFGQPDCENILTNAVPVWMGDRMDSLSGASVHHFFFTDESAADVLAVLGRYDRGEKSEGRRLG